MIVWVIYAFQFILLAVMVYVFYPLLRSAYGYPMAIDKPRLITGICLLALFIAFKVCTVVLEIVLDRQRFLLGASGEFPSASHRVDPDGVRRALASLETMNYDHWPQLRDSVNEFLSLPDGPEKWRKRATLLSTLYVTADRGTLPLEIRKRLNNLRHAINLEIDAP